MAEEVERLLEVLDNEEKDLKAERKNVAELNEAVKVAEKRMEQAVNE